MASFKDVNSLYIDCNSIKLFSYFKMQTIKMTYEDKTITLRYLLLYLNSYWEIRWANYSFSKTDSAEYVPNSP